MKYPVIKENRLFLRAYGKGRRFVSEGLCVYLLRGRDGSGTRVGFTVKKNIGNAVERNRIRRRMREAYRALYPDLKKGRLVVIVARRDCGKYKSTELLAQLRSLFAKAELLKGLNAEG